MLDLPDRVYQGGFAIEYIVQKIQLVPTIISLLSHLLLPHYRRTLVLRSDNFTRFPVT